MAALAVQHESVQALNDQLRQHGIGGTIVVTSGLQALGDDAVSLIIQAVAKFDALDHDNDPYGEHDFGAVQVHGHRVFFKIDYYDVSLRYHSPDPTDPDVTSRVMTVMLPEEY